MAGAVLSFCAMAIAARELLRHMGTFEILFFRTGISLFFVLVVALTVGGVNALHTQRTGAHVGRNILHFGAQAAWVYSLGLLPLATVFAIEFTAPVWTAAMATLLLGERMSRGRVVMIVLGVAGVLIILRPGLAIIHPAAVIMLVGAFSAAAQMIMTKQLSQTESALTVLFWMSIVQTPISFALALPNWVAPAWQDWPWIITVGFGNFTAHYCLTRSLKVADAAAVVPVDFFRLPLIAIVGVMFYGEPFDPAVIVGAAMTFAGTYYSFREEKRHGAT